MNRLQAAVAALGCILFAATADATVFYIDEFQITRNGNSAWFEDPFEDGVPPPSSESKFPNGSQAGYLTLPDPLPGPEQGGKLTLDTAAGAAITSAVTGAPIWFQRARLATNMSNDSADSSGLKVDHTFQVKGVFDLIEPILNLEYYAIRLTDFGAADPNDNTQLRVQRTAAGEWRVRFVEADFGLGIFNEIDSYLLTDIANLNEYEQIALMLSKDDSGSSLIGAAFELIDLNGALPSFAVSMAGHAEIFDGERWTRAAFTASAPRVVPEPATLLLLSLGLAALNCRLRRADPH